MTLVSAALGIGVIIALMAFAQIADKSAVEREQALLKNGFNGLLDEYARRPTAVALWDESVRNLDVSYDPEWTDSNIGEYLAGVLDFDLTVVLDRADAPLYAKWEEDSDALSSIGSALAAASPLVEEVREAERRRGPIADHLRDMAGQPPKVIYAASVSQTDFGPMALTATLVQPDFGLTLPQTSRSAVLISGAVIDQDFLSVLAERYLLSEATLTAPTAPRLPDHAALILRDTAGQAVALVQWHPQRPGAEMLGLSMPLVFIALTALIILAMRYQSKGRLATERLVASEARVTHLAYHDALTGLPNRLLLVDRLNSALGRVRADQQGFAVHCIDLDRFNEINDSFGQQAGDDLITEVTRLFSEVCSPGDTLARLGRDEFGILQSNATRESADAMAMRLIQLTNQPVEIEAGRVFSGCTVGVTLIEDASLDAVECLRRAELALNRAKAAGRGQD